MLELFIESVLSLLKDPLTEIGISPIAVLRGVELFVIVLITVFGAYFMRRFVRSLKLRAEKTASKWDDTFLLHSKAPRGRWFGLWVLPLRSSAHQSDWILRLSSVHFVRHW